MAKEEYKNYTNNNMTSTLDDAKEAARDAAREFTSSKEYKEVKNMAKDFSIKEYTEISEIREDLNSLKSNIIALSKHVKADGRERVSELGDAVKKGMDTLRERGSSSFAVLEDTIRENPRRSLLVAFGIGVLANLIFTSGAKD